MVHNIDMVPNQTWHCVLCNTLMFTSSMCSTLFILSMTFERFYSTIRPHKAASFNTVKRAKFSIVLIVATSIMYNIPHLFITLSVGRQCVPYGKAMETLLGQFHYWLSFMVNFVAPFVLLLIMNSFIIHTIRNRGTLIHSANNQGQGQIKGQTSERQIYIILLLVTFAFLILTTPGYVFLTYVLFYNYTKSAHSFAVYYLLYHIAHKLYNTNCGINFFLYVISGRKFRTDLLRLFGCYKQKTNDRSLGNSVGNSVNVYTVTSDM